MNQLLFGMQNILFSLSQAVQIISMNTYTIQQLLEAVGTMMEHAVTTWRDIRTLEASSTEAEKEIGNGNEEFRKQKRRLRLLRWAMVTAMTYGGYKIVRWLFVAQRRRRTIGRIITGGASAEHPTTGAYGAYLNQGNMYLPQQPPPWGGGVPLSPPYGVYQGDHAPGGVMTGNHSPSMYGY
jgi:hypothetical protein